MVVALFAPAQVIAEPSVYVEEKEEVIEVAEPTWEEVFMTLPIDLQATSKCESDIDGDGVPNPEAENPYSTATGILQFLDGTFSWVWSEVYGTPVDWTLKNDPFIQMEFGMWLYDRYHLSHWEYPCGTLNKP